MIREIVVPKENKHVLHLPDGYIGKTVEVIAFEIGEKQEAAFPDESESLAETVRKAKAFFEEIQVDMANFRFDREEANER